MLEFSAKMKWPSLLRVEAILELSNGESFTLISKGSKIIELVKRIEFEVTSGETSINFKPISKKFFKTIYGAFQNKTMILQLHSGLCDFVEIDGKQYKLKGIFRSYIKGNRSGH